MAHSPQVKAEAMALLVAGNTVGYVAKMTGVPKQTVSRWLNRDVQAVLAEALRTSPQLQAAVLAIREILPGLSSTSRHCRAKKGVRKMGQVRP